MTILNKISIIILLKYIDYVSRGLNNIHNKIKIIETNEEKMITLLVLTLIITMFLIIIILKLLLKIHILAEKSKYVDEANMWHKLAITDDLTELYNRNAYNDKFIKMKEDSKKKVYGIILFDVDNFKIINDTKGHLTGDKVLQNVAKVLKEIFIESKYAVFRIGGDEFSVIAENVSENEIIKKLTLLNRYLENDEIQLSKGYSIVKYDPYEAFKCADEMLYSDKLLKKKHLNI